MGPLSWKLSKLWYFSWRNLRRKSLSSKIFKSQNLGQFLRFGSNFCKWAQFFDRSNFYIATWGLTQLLHWFLRGGWFSLPPSNPKNLDPLPGRVKAKGPNLVLLWNQKFWRYWTLLLESSIPFVWSTLHTIIMNIDFGAQTFLTLIIPSVNTPYKYMA